LSFRLLEFRQPLDANAVMAGVFLYSHRNTFSSMCGGKDRTTATKRIAHNVARSSTAANKIGVEFDWFLCGMAKVLVCVERAEDVGLYGERWPIAFHGVQYKLPTTTRAVKRPRYAPATSVALRIDKRGAMHPPASTSKAAPKEREFVNVAEHICVSLW